MKKTNRKKSPLIAIFKQQRITLLSLVIICSMFVISMLYHGEGGFKDWVESASASKKVTSGHVVGSGQPAIGGPFTLMDMDGQPLTEAVFKDHFTLLFFGFTYCPDVCPTALSKLALVYDDLSEEEQKKTQILFVSVDPKRDTPEQLKAYVQAFHPDFTAATGTKEQIDAMAKAFLAYYAIRAPKNLDDPMNYTVDHSGYTYLMSPTGTYLTHFKGHDEPQDVLTKLRSFLDK